MSTPIAPTVAFRHCLPVQNGAISPSNLRAFSGQRTSSTERSAASRPAPALDWSDEDTLPGFKLDVEHGADPADIDPRGMVS